MRKNSLTENKGLSLSQAQSISNLCNQRAREIDAKLDGVNNYSKSVKITKSSNTETYEIVTAKKLPHDVVNLLTEKANLHACQAFLMENIKAKDNMLKLIKNSYQDESDFIDPPETYRAEVFPIVDEDWAWAELSVDEINEFIEAEAYAAHIGQFIHKGSILDKLRSELPTIAPIEWMVIKDGEKTPVTVTKHHNSEELLILHEELAGLHRAYEQRVNYFKAKVKNLVTEENARIANMNADSQAFSQKVNNETNLAYGIAYKAYQEEVYSIRAEFEKERQAKTKKVAGMRISIDPRFQNTIDGFLSKLTGVQE